MNLAISNIAWNDNHDHYYRLMQRYGFTGLEIAPGKFSAAPYDHLDIARNVKNELLMKYHLPIISMQALLFGVSGLELFASQEKREALKEYMKKAIIYAEVVGCPVLVFGNPKNRVMQHYEQDYPIAIEFFSELGRFAQAHNTCLCIEPNPISYETNFINTIFLADQLVKDVNTPGFAMIVDCGTMLSNNNAPNDILEVLDNTKHIHISTPFLKPLNQYIENYRHWFSEFINVIKKTDYAHYLSIEMANVTLDDVELSLNYLSHLSKDR